MSHLLQRVAGSRDKSMEQAVFENKLIHCWLSETGELPDLLPGQCFPALLTLPKPDVQTVIPLS